MKCALKGPLSVPQKNPMESSTFYAILLDQNRKPREFEMADSFSMEPLQKMLGETIRFRMVNCENQKMNMPLNNQ